MRIGLYGGSFDPIHRGHLEPVREARRVLELDRVIYLPTAQPPHKKRRMAPAWARFTMVELALLDDEDYRVSPFEMNDERPSYTVDTVTHFRRSLPEAELVLLIGADSWADFRKWKDWRRILETVDLAVMARPGDETPRTALDEPFLEMQRAGRLHFVSNPPVAVSSTDLRRRLGRGERPEGEAPALVLDYIHKYRLYLEDPKIEDDDPTR